MFAMAWLRKPDSNSALPLGAAIKAGTAVELQAAIGKCHAWQFSGDEPGAPELNAGMAQVLMKLIALEVTAGRGHNSAMEQKLKDALSNAATNPAIKARLG
jgi:hypothetical protein